MWRDIQLTANSFSNYLSVMFNSRLATVSWPLRLWAYSYRLECVDGYLGRLNTSDQEPSGAGVVVPSSEAYLLLRSPLIHTSIASMLAALLTVPSMLYVAFVETFSLLVGLLMTTTGAPPAAGADAAGADGAGAALLAPVP